MSLITKDDYEDIMNAMVTTIQSNINNQLGKIVEEIETIKERLSSFEVDKETKDMCNQSSQSSSKHKLDRKRKVQSQVLPLQPVAAVSKSSKSSARSNNLQSSRTLPIKTTKSSKQLPVSKLVPKQKQSLFEVLPNQLSRQAIETSVINDFQNNILFYDIFSRLEKIGWQTGFAIGISSNVYLPPWTTHNFEIHYNTHGRKSNIDYFLNESDVMDYYRTKYIDQQNHDSAVPFVEQDLIAKVQEKRKVKLATTITKPSTSITKPSTAITKPSIIITELASNPSSTSTTTRGKRTKSKSKSKSKLKIHKVTSSTSALLVPEVSVFVSIPPTIQKQGDGNTITVEQAIRQAIDCNRSSDDAEYNIVGRENEIKSIISFLNNCLSLGQGLTMIAQGLPGQGKSHVMNLINRLIVNYDNQVFFTKYPQLNQFHDLLSLQSNNSVEIIRCVGLVLSSSDAWYTAIGESLNIVCPPANGSGLSIGQRYREILLERFSSPTCSANSQLNDSSTGSVKKIKLVKNPMTIIYIDEIDKTDKRTIQELIKISNEPNSSLVIIGLCNTLHFYTDLKYDPQLSSLVDKIQILTFKPYFDEVEDVLPYYSFGLMHKSGAKMLARKVMGRAGDIRHLQGLVNQIYDSFINDKSRQELDRPYDPNDPPIDFKYIIHQLGECQARPEIKSANAANQPQMMIVISMLVKNVGVGSDGSANAEEMFRAYEDYLLKDLNLNETEVNPFDFFCRTIEELRDSKILKQVGGADHAKMKYLRPSHPDSRYQLALDHDDILLRVTSEQVTAMHKAKVARGKNKFEADTQAKSSSSSSSMMEE